MSIVNKCLEILHTSLEPKILIQGGPFAILGPHHTIDVEEEDTMETG